MCDGGRNCVVFFGFFGSYRDLSPVTLYKICVRGQIPIRNRIVETYAGVEQWEPAIGASVTSEAAEGYRAVEGRS